jgi:hypothetical protein
MPPSRGRQADHTATVRSQCQWPMVPGIARHRDNAASDDARGQDGALSLPLAPRRCDRQPMWCRHHPCAATVPPLVTLLVRVNRQGFLNQPDIWKISYRRSDWMPQMWQTNKVTGGDTVSSTNSGDGEWTTGRPRQAMSASRPVAGLAVDRPVCAPVTLMQRPRR